MFTGCHDHVLDDKGRTSLPKEFRQSLEELSSETSRIVGFPSRCLGIVPEAVFQKLMASLTDLGLLSREVQQMRRFFPGMAFPCPVDKQGRILIPPKLRSWARLERDIVFAGVGAYIEVWNQQLHQSDLDYTSDHYPECSEALERARGAVS